MAAIRSDPCECGRGLRRISKIEGRSADFILAPSGNHLSLIYYTSKLKYYDQYIKEFQINQISPTKCNILVIPRETYTQKIGQQIINSIHEIEPELQYTITLVNEIPAEPSGKKKILKKSF